MGIVVTIDVDDVVLDLVGKWLQLYRTDTGETIYPEHILSWDITKYVPCGVEIYKYIVDNPGIYDSIPPRDGALNGVRAIRRMPGVDKILFATSPVEGAQGAKYRWLKKYGFLTKLDDYCEIADKNFLSTDIIVDDNLYNLVIARNSNDILFDRPWNRGALFNRRAFNWQNVVEFVSKTLEKEGYDG